MTPKKSILIIDDSSEDRAVYRRYLKGEVELNLDIYECESGEDALQLCLDIRPDLILVDYLLPDMDGLELLETCRTINGLNKVPAVLLTGQGNEAVALKAMKKNVRDYLIKGQLTPESLRQTVRKALGVAEELPGQKKVLKIAIVDDNPDDIFYYTKHIEISSIDKYKIYKFETGEEALEECQKTPMDAILLDYLLPDMNGVEFLEELQKLWGSSQLPVVMVTGHGNEAIVVEAMKAGAQDYLIKSNITSEILCRSINNAMEQTRLQLQLAESRERQRAMGAIALKIRSSLQLEEILQATVDEVRKFLKCDRAVVFDLAEDFRGEVVAASAGQQWKSLLGWRIEEPCFYEESKALLLQGKARTIADIETAGLSDCNLELLRELQVKANLIVPILLPGEDKSPTPKLWGLLVAHECSQPRQWQESEIQFLGELAVQVAVGIQQAILLERTQEIAERDRAVLTVADKIRESLDKQEIFEAAASAVRESLKCDLVGVYQFYPDWGGEFIAESVGDGWMPLVGPNIKTVWEDTYLQETEGGRYRYGKTFFASDVREAGLQDCHLEMLERFQIKAFGIAPIFLGKKLWGLLGAYQNDGPRQWKASEVELLERVSDRLGIAVNQAELFGQIREQAIALQEAKEAAEKADRAKSDFLASMSHELRTPLNAVIGYSDLLKRLVRDPDCKSYAESIDASGKALLALINDILDLSKIEAGRIEINYELNSLKSLICEVSHVFAMKAEEKGLLFETNIPPDFPQEILTDELRLRQILFNAVGNAIKFTDKGFIKVSVSYNYIDKDGEKINLEISVEDTGIGIAKSQQERIFEPFIQSENQSARKYGGTGLGLAITKRLTEMLGGEIRLESELGKGCKFTFIFPETVCDNSLSGLVLEYSVKNSLEQLPPLKILVADDIKLNRDLIRGYFGGTQHSILEAEDGERAIELAKYQQPDGILMDLLMPNLDGIEATKRLKEDPATREIPIIIITAACADKERENLEAICEGFLSKPLSYDSLTETLKAIFPPRETNDQSDKNVDLVELEELPSTQELSELLEKLRETEQTVWLQVQKTLKMREIREFAGSLNDWGKEYRYEPLVSYASLISTQLGEFDWVSLPETVKAFPDVISKLESCCVC